MMEKKTNNSEEVKKFITTRKELANTFKTAIGNRSISAFVKECGMVDPSIIANIVNEKISVLPERRLFRVIEKASQRRVTYSYLCQICGYPEYDCDDSWDKFYPERGSVYWVDLGYSNLDSEQNGIRPCLIISNNTGNKNSSTLIVAVITGQIKKELLCHVKLTVDDGMRQNSIICLEQIRTVSKRRLFYNRIPIKVLDLSDEKIFEVNTALEKQFGLIDCLFNNEVAFELIEQIKNIEQNKKVKKSSILNGMYEKLGSYCKKYNKSIDRVINNYENNEINENCVYVAI